MTELGPDFQNRNFLTFYSEILGMIYHCHFTQKYGELANVKIYLCWVACAGALCGCNCILVDETGLKMRFWKLKSTQLDLYVHSVYIYTKQPSRETARYNV